MRVTHMMQFNLSATNLRKQNNRLFEAQQEAATGKKTLRPSDGAAETRRILSSRSTLASIEQFKKNRATLNTLLQTSDTALESVGNILIRAKELTVQGANDTLSNSDRSFIAKEVEQLFAQALQIGNTNIEGHYIFAGCRPDKAPLSPLITTQNTIQTLATSGTLSTLNTGDLTINGTAIRASAVGDDTLSTSDNAASAISLAKVINEASVTTGVTARACTTFSLTASSFGNLNTGQFIINGRNITGTITSAADLVTAVNAASIPGVVATSSGANNLTLTAADGRNLRLQTSGSVVGMNFSEFSLNGAALDQTTTGTVSLLSDQPITIGGMNPAHAGLSSGTTEQASGARFIGDNSTINLAMGTGQNIPSNTLSGDFLVTDLRPNIDANTPLFTLRQGQGISAGSIKITDRIGNTATIDLSGATTVNDVISAISSASGVNVTAKLNTTADGITIVDDNTSPTRNLTIENVSGGTTASHLGIVADRPGNIIGAPLEPILTASTPLSLLHAGKGVTPGTIHVANGATESDVDLSSATTIGEVLALINGSSNNVNASINVTGNALEVRSNDPTTVAIVTEVGSGKTAAELGIQGPGDSLKTLALLREALEVTDQAALDRLLIHIDAGIDRVAELRADAGARMNRVELVDGNQEELKTTVTTLMAEAEEVDIFEAYSRLENASTALQSALAATARTQQLSLLEFLR